MPRPAAASTILVGVGLAALLAVVAAILWQARLAGEPAIGVAVPAPGEARVADPVAAGGSPEDAPERREAPGADPADAGGAVVVGRVADGAGTGLPDVLVTLDVEPDAVGTAAGDGRDRDGAPAWRTAGRSGADGRFRFARVPAAGHRVVARASAPGRAEGWSEPRIAAPGVEVDVGDVVLQLVGAIAGRVLDEAGEPVAGAEVRWQLQRGPAPRPDLDGRAGGRSAADGTFRVENAPAGVVRLAAVLEGRVSPWSRPVAVEPGRDTEGVVLLCERGVSVPGRIVDAESGAGVPGEVRLTSAWGLVACAATADAGGRFTLDGLRSGASYHFEVRCDGHAYSQSSGSFGGINQMTVTDELVREGLEIPVRPARVRPLRAVDDATGAPVPGAAVARPAPPIGGRSPHPAPAPSELVFGRADGNGIYGPPDRTHLGVVVVQAEGYLPQWSTLAVGPADAGPYEVRLKRGATLVVDVVGAAGGVAVELFGRAAGLRAGPAADAPLARIASATTGADGKAALAPVPPGAAVVRARGPRGSVGVAACEVQRDVERSTCTVQLAPPAAMFGLLPGLRSEVLAVDDLGFATTATTGDGGAWRIDGLPGGEVLVSVRPAGAGSQGVTVPRSGVTGHRVHLSPGAEVRVDLPGFGEGARIEGRATVNGEPAASRLVFLRWLGADDERSRPVLRGRSLVTAAVRADGTFVVEGLERGRWRVSLVGEVGAHQRFDLAVLEGVLGAGARTEVTLEARTGTLVLEAFRGGDPVGWVSVDLEGVPEGATAPVRESLLVPGAGRLVIEELPAGRYRLGGTRIADGPIALEVPAAGTCTLPFSVR